MEAIAEVQQFRLGDTHTYEQIIDDQLVQAFADLSGDRNPIHLNDEVAKQSRFGQRIAHGAILFGIISKVLGMEMPGLGTVYLRQVCNFKLPVFIGDTVKLEARITEIGKKNVATISTTFTKQTGQVVMDGFAEVKLPGWLFEAKLPQDRVQNPTPVTTSPAPVSGTVPESGRTPDLMACAQTQHSVA